jgi:hypothetical protein
VHRFQDKGWAYGPIDVLTFETSYFRQQEASRLTKRAGAPISALFKLTGILSRGEFGDNFRNIFAPASETQFQFERWTTVRGRQAAVYSYRVDRSKEPYMVSTAQGGKPVSATVGLRGELVIDARSFAVYRADYIADQIPGGFPVQLAKVTVEYDNAEIEGKAYLLPSKAVALLRAGKTEKRNETVFSRYRKFTADTAIRFAGDEP